jgi:TonB-linked SusC/RagA family outer membrane protein
MAGKRRNHLIFFLILCLGFSSLYSQTNKTIEGKVFDSQAEPLPGATVTVEGSSIGTITNPDGYYSITVPFEKNQLRFSFIGTLSKIVDITDQHEVNVTLEKDVLNLEEVLVVGYGTQKKESVVGAITQVNSEALVKVGVQNISSAISGKLSGVVTLQNNGKPGEDNPSILIRGKSSWVDSSPLVLVDGIERDFTDIDINEVATLSVLKDASATAVYGTRGANGVILITTKRGTNAKPKMNVSFNQGFKFSSDRPEYYDSYQVLQWANMAKKNDNTWGILTSPEDLEHYKKQDLPYIYPSTNWFDELVDVGYTSNANFNVSGGDDFVKYFGSLGYLHDGDILATEKNGNFDPRFYYDRFNLRTNLDFSLTKTTTFSVNLGGSIQIQNQPDLPFYQLWHGIFAGSVNISPLYYDENTINRYPDENYNGGIRLVASQGEQNPYTLLYGGELNPEGITTGGFEKRNKSKLNTDFILKQDLDFITEGLSIQGTVSYNTMADYRKFYSQSIETYLLEADRTWNRFPNYEEDLNPLHMTSDNISRYSRKLYYEGRLNYIRSFGKHDVSGMAIFNRSELYNQVAEPYKYEAWASRVTYGYDNRYLAEVNLGYTGSEQFAPKNRFGFFPAYAIGWNIGEEQFIQDNLEFLSRFKVRYSYGKTGNDAGDRWLYYSTWQQLSSFNVRDAVFGANDVWPSNNGSYAEGDAANYSAQWEVAIKNNLGFELGFLSNVISLNVDFFKENRDNILMQPQTVPAWVQVDFKDLNIGKTKNHGYEIELGFNQRSKTGLHYYIKSNFSFSENRVVYADDPESMPNYQRTEGKPIGVHNGYMLVPGFFNSVDDINNYIIPAGATNIVEGDLKYIDYNADGKIDQNDNAPIGFSTYPIYNYGATIGFDYKNISFYALFQGSKGKSSYFNRLAGYAFADGYDRVLEHQTDFYSIDNTNAKQPSFHYAGGILSSNNGLAYNLGGNERYTYLETDYIRLKEVELAYTFKVKALKKAGIKNTRVYVNGHNLFTLSNLEWGDPEKSSNDPGALNNYPLIKRYNVGIKLNF